MGIGEATSVAGIAHWFTDVATLWTLGYRLGETHNEDWGIHYSVVCVSALSCIFVKLILLAKTQTKT